MELIRKDFKKDERMQKRHQPYHIYLDDYLYFITSHTYLDRYQMIGEFEKNKILTKIKDFFKTSILFYMPG